MSQQHSIKISRPWLIPAAASFLTMGVGVTFAFAQGTYRQGQFDAFQARITGGSSEQGKCTIEVVVDGVAEVEIHGREGRLRTMSGGRSTWRRMDCNQPLPINPDDFRFSGQEGRGRQTLLREPKDNSGVPVIRIEDPSGGAEGYKFDLTWRAGTGGSVGAGNFPRNSNNGSIFEPGNNNTGNTFPGTSGQTRSANTWNRNVNFSGTGTGYFRNARGGDEDLRNASVTVNRNGRVRVELTANRQTRYVLQGNLVQADSNRLLADVSGAGVNGTMQIMLDNRNRVDELSMTGNGRDQYDLRWEAR